MSNYNKKQSKANLGLIGNGSASESKEKINPSNKVGYANKFPNNNTINGKNSIDNMISNMMDSNLKLYQQNYHYEGNGSDQFINNPINNFNSVLEKELKESNEKNINSLNNGNSNPLMNNVNNEMNNGGNVVIASEEVFDRHTFLWEILIDLELVYILI